jgi:hypothetical protein
MPKTVYTERDIEDLAKRGVLSLVVDDDVVVTDLARDKAMRLGIGLVREHDSPPCAPERPYISKLASPSASFPVREASSLPESTKVAAAPGSPATGDDLSQRVRSAVLARLGDSVDPKLLETIIQRVLKNVGVK